MGLRRDQPVAFEDPPDGRDGGQLADAANEVMSDGLGTGVVDRPRLVPFEVSGLQLEHLLRLGDYRNAVDVSAALMPRSRLP